MKTFADKFPKLAAFIQGLFGAGNTEITMAEDTISMKAEVFEKLEAREATLEDIQEQLTNATNEITTLKADLQQAQADTQAKQEQVEVLQADAAAYEESLEAKDTRITELEAKVEELGAQPGAAPGTAHAEDEQPDADAQDPQPWLQSEADAELAALQAKLNPNK